MPKNTALRVVLPKNGRTKPISRDMSPAMEAEAERLSYRLVVATAFADGRRMRGWTQQELADRAGIKQSRVAELEGTDGNPTLGTIARLGKVLGLRLRFELESSSPSPVPSSSSSRSDQKRPSGQELALR